MMISIIVAVRGNADDLGEQLAALACQSYEAPWELLVVDNAEDEACRRVAQRWADRMPLQIIDGPRHALGPGPAKNLGARHARGETLVFCDGDDVVGQGWLSAIAVTMRHANVAGGAIDYRPLNPPGAAPTDGLTLRQLPVALQFLPFAIGANLAVSRRAFDTVGGYWEERLAGCDVDLCWRLQLAGFELDFAPHAIVSKRARRGLRAMWVQQARWGRSCVEFYRRYRDVGMPRSSFVRALGAYVWLLGRIPQCATARGRRRWVRDAAPRWGRLTMSLRLRTLYL